MNKTHTTKDLERNKLSDYLPHLAFDEDKNEFINADNTFGYAFECSPFYFIGTKTIDTIASILRQDYGKGAVLQFILFADTNIDNYCSQVKRGDIRQTPLTKKMSKYHADFLNNPKAYGQKIKANKLKNFRLFIFLKTSESLKKLTVKAFEESLIGAGLAPRQIKAQELLSLLRQLLNNSQNNSKHYDENTSIAKQVIQSDTEIDFGHKDYITVGDEFVSVVSPKDFPESLNDQKLNANQVNELLGSYKGGINDLEQITSRFLWSCNILLDKVDGEIRQKSLLASAQRMGAKQSNNINDRISVLSHASKNIHSDYYLKFIPTLVLFADSEEDLSIATTKARRLWESQGFLMQHENHIKHILFLSALPFGLIAGKNNSNIGLMDRHFIAPAKAVANQLPIQADFFGFGYPIVPFVGRKGQVQGLDIFSKGSNNHNFLCCATSGSGKSFFVNWMLLHYFAAGVKIRINDIGGSYKKIASIVDGVYIDIADRSVNLNPFQSIKGLDDEDKNADVETIAMVLGEMCCSKSDITLSDEEIGLLTHAVKHVVAQGEFKNSIDLVQDYLVNLEKYSSNDSIPNTLHDRAKELSFNLCDFGSSGDYGDYFNGVSENSWQDNPFVVLELESLSAKPALMKVVSLQIINMMTQEMYQGDRSEKKMSIFDEVAFMFGSSQRLAKVVEDGYRRARKYNGSFGTIFQSILDTQLFGRVGEVMRNNAAFQFYLESRDYAKAIESKLISYDGIAKELLLSLKSNRPHYSEIFMDTPGGVGISRLMVSPYGHAVATTDADEVHEIEQYQEQGLEVDKALEKFAQARGLNVSE
ncbi:TraC family protein [Bathymodiolus thermophilus thioautotrophic gill symbiont]|uniref:TraG P-loop domain-containing protein n=1 Tax=Bathymodiolus thermophilus thioautotrophic gill symbiont TaxID=2360 RepID=A0A1J5TY08_9GAMM|nr:TraC family protein [Bathymodiolus thermophilus thioautotrophic gill symbiont]AYQ57065.1 hypothetical protein MS2017_1377 [Bathymodiolus thermophilus thioautotrophic gill symbiont]OIR25634.1 hypothetical protein BGC33_13745 [Bathymodiolus thermophilus thioautotrophic gill symbiont]